jgi:predicted ATPase/class 3 adenylate cyclase
METTDSSSNTSGASGQLFGDILRQLRHAADLTQAELAERANLSIRGLSDLERGINHSPRRETLLALADALGLDGDERHRFFETARRRSVLPAASSSLPSSNSARPPPELIPPTTDSEGTGSVEPTDDIQVFLIADVRGYSTYTDAHRDEDAAQLALRFAALAGTAVESHSGQVLEVRGDEVFAVFASARAALRAAIVLQESVEQAAATTPEQPIRCGIGVEAGEAVAVPGGYRGQAINLAARLCARAGPGEVLAGETVIGLARKVAGLVFLDRGLATLKGVAVPVRITQVVAAPTETPSEPREERASAPEPVKPAEGSPRVGAVGNFLSAEPRYRLVAREAEMARLLAALDRVQVGTGQLVLLVGEPGVGKTRLAQEVLREARVRGFRGITGRCYAPQATVPYYPFLEALSGAAAMAAQALRTALPREWPEVALLIPDQRLGASMGQGLHIEDGGAGDQQRLFWQVTGFLQTLAEEKPLALLLDDLHWADGASLELLLHLARQTRNRPVLLVGTYRESEVPADHPLAVGVRDLIRAHLVERIELQQLSHEATAALLAAALETGEVSEAVIDLIYAPTEGNAFFVEELLRTLLERGEILQGSTGRWEPRAGAVAAVPATVQAAVLERASRLSPSAQEMLAIASVLGQRFQFDDLLATCGRMPQTPWALTTSDGARSEVEAEARLEAELEEALRARVLREVGSSEYAFSHALAQRAIYDQLPVRRRRRVHRAAAENLERVDEGPRVQRVADLAYHFLQAEESARALPYVLQAGEQALTVYAYPEAEQQFRMALALAQQLGDQDASSVAAEHLGAALGWQLRNDEGVVVLEQAIAEAEQHGDLARLARLFRALTTVNIDQKAGAELVARLVRLIERTKAHGPSPDLAQLYLALAYRYVLSGQYAQGLDAVEQALQMAQTVGDPVLLATARISHGEALSALGHLEEALAELMTALPALEHRETLEGQDTLGSLLVNLGWVLTRLGRIGEAEACFERNLALCEQMRNRDVVVAMSISCSTTALVRGEWAVAEGYVERAVALRPHLDTSSWVHGMLYNGVAQLQLARGQLEDATHSAEVYLAWAQQNATVAYGLESLRAAQKALAELDLRKGDPASARARLLPLLDREGMVELEVNPLLPLLVWADLELDEVEAAEALATQMVERLRTHHDHLTLVDALRMEATVRIRQERWDEAEATLQEALMLARQMPYPSAEAKALATYGDLYIASGQPERAHDKYEAALAILRQLGEVPYAERVERALAEMARH